MTSRDVTQMSPSATEVFFAHTGAIQIRLLLLLLLSNLHRDNITINIRIYTHVYLLGTVSQHGLPAQP